MSSKDAAPKTPPRYRPIWTPPSMYGPYETAEPKRPKPLIKLEKNKPRVAPNCPVRAVPFSDTRQDKTRLGLRRKSVTGTVHGSGQPPQLDLIAGPGAAVTPATMAKDSSFLDKLHRHRSNRNRPSPPWDRESLESRTSGESPPRPIHVAHVSDPEHDSTASASRLELEITATAQLDGSGTCVEGPADLGMTEELHTEDEDGMWVGEWNGDIQGVITKLRSLKK
ncbi:hypothetical protein FB45DRAFT_958715 [Roridomyces roridus]|uniref:Uncharacterized protein n=1 Tax=Roridomyces roridus TaxID=1738132 RepID=A0AAD7AYK9_9AGAR|nr:hypothetical protein FB45DRAFT_958715 [Roridomyces roridus]